MYCDLKEIVELALVFIGVKRGGGVVWCKGEQSGFMSGDISSSRVNGGVLILDYISVECIYSVRQNGF
ncbi:MAG: hypothetical protein EZS28_049341 [Streblomastix strix]|uniref:Uncharacterized protein n=1 Tax=Streblomastix strix TaxID=222440 RepID=A0A5J4TBA1_9EUKA|nr:MAG: hypothetical protein EZS28_049341 [Streblomastix strix]